MIIVIKSAHYSDFGPIFREVVTNGAFLYVADSGTAFATRRATLRLQVNVDRFHFLFFFFFFFFVRALTPVPAHGTLISYVTFASLTARLTGK
ncbi:MAG: hypothetical protein ACLQOO_15290 [Terriglobia bacterium]